MPAAAAALLRAIHAAPADDLPRLVYADWLDEHGDPARAEFIRAQCEIASLPEWDARRPALEDRAHELLAAHEPAWFGPQVEPLAEWEWSRGFVSSVTANRRKLRHLDPGFLALHPIESVDCNGRPAADRGSFTDWANAGWTDSVVFLSCRGASAHPDEFAAFLRGTRLTRLSGLDWSQGNRAADIPAVFRHAPVRDRITRLVVGGYYAGRGGGAEGDWVELERYFDCFADAPLADLALPECGLTGRNLRELLAFRWPLRALDLTENPIAPDAWRAFRAAHSGLRLSRLDVSGTPLAGISLGPLLDAPCLERLDVLEINRCGSARANIPAVVTSPFWTRGTELRMHNGTIDVAGVEALCASTGPRGLRVLDLSDNYVRTEGVRTLCAAPWAGSLTWLGLSGNYLDDDALASLAGCGRFTHLRTLHVARNNFDLEGSVGEHVSDAGLDHLAAAPSLAALRVLNLADNPVTHRGIDAVLNAPYWRLSGLGLGGCGLSPMAVHVLATSPRLARLEWLDLSSNPRLGGDELRPLAESPYLSRLCELDVGGIDVDRRTRTVLRQRLGPRLSH